MKQLTLLQKLLTLFGLSLLIILVGLGLTYFIPGWLSLIICVALAGASSIIIIEHYEDKEAEIHDL